MRVEQPYGKRYEDLAHSQEPKKKVFIACEGEKTEYTYFRGVMEHRTELLISPFLEVIPVRHESCTGSNPLQILAEAKQAVDHSGRYFKSIDTLCIIVDRDMHSFKHHQYDELLRRCQKDGFFLAVSNPCFELWLLLHYSDLTEYDLEIILANKKIGSRTQTELFLKDKLGGSYSKTRLKFAMQFLDKIELAIKNASLYVTNVDTLKNTVGSNVGVLLELLQGKRS